MMLFTVGPVPMYPETLKESGEQIPYFRTEQFSEKMLESEALLKKLMGAPEGSKVAFLTASGTGAMEAAVACTFSKNDKVLIVNGGGFGRRFCEICDLHGIPYDTVDLAFGEALTAEKLKPFEGKKYAGLLANMDETSTGQLYDVKLLSSFCRQCGAYLVIDAISSFLADPMDMEDMGIDEVIISSQKALSLAPGISAVVLSPRVYKERIEGRHGPLYYLDLETHIVNMKRGQTPFTPAVGILLNLNSMLKRLDAEGVDKVIADTNELAVYFRRKAKEAGLKIPDYPLSNAVTPVLVDNAHAVFEELSEKYDIYVTPSGGDLRDKLLRVGHIGNHSKEDYDILLEKMKEVLG
jgi:aspartate aminotransferase-like enzyme